MESNQTEEHNELDLEWVQLMYIAKKLHISKEEIRSFLEQAQTVIHNQAN